MVAFGGYGGSSYSNNAIEVELYNQGATVGMLYVSNWSGTAWTSSTAGTPTVGTWNHVVYADENGTGFLWMNDTLVGGGSGTPVGSNSGYAGNTTPPVTDLSALPANVLVGCRNYGGSIAEGFNGAIDQVRLFSFAAGAFNITDTDVGTAPAHNPGDVNGDKQVDINDLTIVLTNYGQTGMVWSQGAIDGDPAGTVDINDLTIVLTDYGVTYSAGVKGIKAVPEPGTLALIAAGLAGLLAYVCCKRR